MFADFGLSYIRHYDRNDIVYRSLHTNDNNSRMTLLQSLKKRERKLGFYLWYVVSIVTCYVIYIFNWQNLRILLIYIYNN